MSEKYKKFLFRWFDTNFDDEEFDKGLLKKENYLIIRDNSDGEVVIHISLRMDRILVSHKFFGKMNSWFGVGAGDLSDLFREYLSEKLDYDFSKYPVMPS
jgi:hypothetical protein